MAEHSTLLQALGGEAGCTRLATQFYARVGKDAVLRPLFPGKTLRCATEEFASFLIQFLGGDEEQTQHRWWLSLRESHARFRIDPAQRQAWLRHMAATLDAVPCDEETRSALRQFFTHSSAYVTGKDAAGSEHTELTERWREQLQLDNAIAAITAGQDQEAMRLASNLLPRPSVFVGLLARMLETGRKELTDFAVEAARRDPSLGSRRFGGRALLHYAAGAGSLELVTTLLQGGIDPDLQNAGGHTALYCVANQCGSEAGPRIVRALVQAGADVNACGGVTRATPLHMAARRGFVQIAQALLECGANSKARDNKGVTPLQRAVNCRKPDVASLLRSL